MKTTYKLLAKHTIRFDLEHLNIYYDQKNRPIAVIEGRSLEVIGSGVYGTVFDAKYVNLPSFQDKIPLALKLSLNRDSKIKNMEDEIQILSKIGHHPYIVSMSHKFEGKRGEIGYFMPFIQGKNLHACIYNKDFKANKVFLSRLGLCISEALAYLHQRDIEHRDIKPANILVDKERFVLCDFGLSFSPQFPRSNHTLVVSENYRAPEVTYRNYLKGAPVDIWALACTLYETATKSFLFTLYDSLSNLPELWTKEFGLPPAWSKDDNIFDFEDDFNCFLSKVKEQWITSSSAVEGYEGNRTKETAFKKGPLPELWESFIVPALRLEPDKRPLAQDLKKLFTDLSLASDTSSTA